MYTLSLVAIIETNHTSGLYISKQIFIMIWNWDFIDSSSVILLLIKIKFVWIHDTFSLIISLLCYNMKQIWIWYRLSHLWLLLLTWFNWDLGMDK